MKLRPVDFATDGVFVAGLAHYPKPMDEAIAQAKAAAARAAVVLAQDAIRAGGVVAQVDPATCSGCQACVGVCPFGAISYKEDEKTCAKSTRPCARAAAPAPPTAPRSASPSSGSATSRSTPRWMRPWRNWTQNWKRLRALNSAPFQIEDLPNGRKRVRTENYRVFSVTGAPMPGPTWPASAACSIPPNIRVIRVMCSGTVSPHHVLRAFQKGADGVLIGGCHIGDCHYLRGNYMTIKRMTFLQDLLKFTGYRSRPAAPGMDLRRRRSQICPDDPGVYRKNQEDGPLAPEAVTPGGVTRPIET